MAAAISTLGARMLAQASGVATQMSGGTTAAEVQALARLLSLCEQQPKIFIQLMKLTTGRIGQLIPE